MTMKRFKSLLVGILGLALIAAAFWSLHAIRLHRLEARAETLGREIWSNVCRGLDGMGKTSDSPVVPRLSTERTIPLWTAALKQTRELQEVQRAIADSRWRWSPQRPLAAAKAALMGVPLRRPPSGMRAPVSPEPLESALEFLQWTEKERPGRLDDEGARRMGLYFINANLIAMDVGKPQPFESAMLGQR